jgi:gliding motility-associated-like protein
VKTDEIYVGCHLDLLFDTTHVSCNGFSDGSIEMQILVGLGPFDISWHHDGNFLSHEQNIYNLAAGDYIYTITDTEECMSMDTITIREPDILAMSYSAFPACYEILNGAIALDVTGGTEPYNYSWSNGSSEPDLTGIGPGLYGVTLTDDHQCPPISETIVVSELTEILITLNGTNLNCFHDGSGAVEVTELSGGTGNFVLYEWLKDATFYAGTSSIGDLMAGTYTLKVTDDYGCYGIKSINLSEPNEIVLTLTADSDIETQGSAYLQVTGGVPPYSFLWNTGAISQDISYLSGGNYCVTVIDTHSCSVSDSIWVEVHYKVFAPTAFSPNGDGLNDQFVFFDVGNDLKELDLTIFDRFGKKVFQTSDIKNCWNGKMHNSAEDCPVEVYTWYCKLLFTNGESWIYNGNVSLLR